MTSVVTVLNASNSNNYYQSLLGVHKGLLGGNWGGSRKKQKNLRGNLSLYVGILVSTINFGNSPKQFNPITYIFKFQNYI